MGEMKLPEASEIFQQLKNQLRGDLYQSKIDAL